MSPGNFAVDIPKCYEYIKKRQRSVKKLSFWQLKGTTENSILFELQVWKISLVEM